MLYAPVNVEVAPDQYEKLKSQIGRKHLSIKIQVKSKYGASTERHTLLLTRAQIAAIEKARESGKR